MLGACDEYSDPRATDADFAAWGEVSLESVRAAHSGDEAIAEAALSLRIETGKAVREARGLVQCSDLLGGTRSEKNARSTPIEARQKGAGQ